MEKANDLLKGTLQGKIDENRDKFFDLFSEVDAGKVDLFSDEFDFLFGITTQECKILKEDAKSRGIKHIKLFFDYPQTYGRFKLAKEESSITTNETRKNIVIAKIDISDTPKQPVPDVHKEIAPVKKPKTQLARRKVIIDQMYPVKKWLSVNEACAFLDISINVFKDIANKYQLTQATLPPNRKGDKSNKIYYRVSELEDLIEENILIRKVKGRAL